MCVITGVPVREKQKKLKQKISKGITAKIFTTLKKTTPTLESTKELFHFFYVKKYCDKIIKIKMQTKIS